MRDIKAMYEVVSGEIKTFFNETKMSNQEVLETSTKSANEIRESFEKSKKELDDVLAYRKQLEIALNQVNVNTDERVEQLCKTLDEMTKNA